MAVITHLAPANTTSSLSIRGKKTICLVVSDKSFRFNWADIRDGKSPTWRRFSEGWKRTVRPEWDVCAGRKPQPRPSATAGSDLLLRGSCINAIAQYIISGKTAFTINSQAAINASSVLHVAIYYSCSFGNGRIQDRQFRTRPWFNASCRIATGQPLKTSL